MRRLAPKHLATLYDAWAHGAPLVQLAAQAHHDRGALRDALHRYGAAMALEATAAWLLDRVLARPPSDVGSLPDAPDATAHPWTDRPRTAPHRGRRPGPRRRARPGPG